MRTDSTTTPLKSIFGTHADPKMDRYPIVRDEKKVEWSLNDSMSWFPITHCSGCTCRQNAAPVAMVPEPWDHDSFADD